MYQISRRQFLGTAAATLAGGLAACGGGNGASTTLLVYMLGSNLESRGNAATKNLLEMLSAQGSVHTKVVITTGGARKDDPTSLVSNWTTVKRFELAEGKLNELADLGPMSMDAGGTLQDFLIWGAGAYPSDRTMLMMWDHGGGYLGFGGDENFPTLEGMRMPVMAGALQGFQDATGITLDYIGFDACLMATVEVAKLLQPYARYLGASQELEPGSGWDWKAIINTLSSQPALAAPQFGGIAAQAYYAKQQREIPSSSLQPSFADYLTFSVIDLSRMASLLGQLDQWAGDVRTYYDAATKAQALGAKSAALNSTAPAAERVFWPPMFQAPQTRASLPGAKALSGALEDAGGTADPSIERWKQVAMSRLKATSFGNKRDLVDLHQFSSLLSARGIATASQPALGQALQDAVSFNVAGRMASEATGLSIYFPTDGQSAAQLAVYQALGMPAGYMGLIARHEAQEGMTPSSIIVSSLQSPPQTPDIVEGTIGSLYGVRLADLMLVQPVNQTVVRVTGTTPLASGSAYTTGAGDVASYDTRLWLQLDGQPLLLYTLSNQSDATGQLAAIMLGAPIRLKSAADSDAKIMLMLISCTRDASTGGLSGQIIGAQDIDFNHPYAPPDRVDRDIRAGDIVEPVHIFYDLKKKALAQGPGGEAGIGFGSPVTLTADFGLRPSPLVAGSYTLLLSVTDLAGELGFSAPMSFVKS